MLEFSVGGIDKKSKAIVMVNAATWLLWGNISRVTSGTTSTRSATAAISGNLVVVLEIAEKANKRRYTEASRKQGKLQKTLLSWDVKGRYRELNIWNVTVIFYTDSRWELANPGAFYLGIRRGAQAVVYFNPRYDQKLSEWLNVRLLWTCSVETMTATFMVVHVSRCHH